MLRPICAKCRVEMVVLKNGFVVKDPQVGQFCSTYWRGDLYQCPKCGASIITGFGKGVSAEEYPEEALQFEYS